MFKADFDWINSHLETFGGSIPGAKPYAFENERSKTRKYHDKHFAEKLFKKPHCTFFAGHWVMR